MRRSACLDFEPEAVMTDTFPCSIAHTPEDLDRVYRLRYECYRRDGAIPPHPDRRFTDRFDVAPNHFSFWAPEPAATVRISVVRPDLGWNDAPARHVYGGHPRFEPIAAASFVEASRLCFGPLARREVFVRLVANMAALAEFYEVEWLIACPRVEHVRVYERLFGFRPLAEPRRYFGVAFETRLLGIRREELRAFVAPDRLMPRAWSQALSRIASGQRGMAMSASSGK
jgi:hypothetical protein